MEKKPPPKSQGRTHSTHAPPTCTNALGVSVVPRSPSCPPVFGSERRYAASGITRRLTRPHACTSRTYEVAEAVSAGRRDLERYVLPARYPLPRPSLACTCAFTMHALPRLQTFADAMRMRTAHKTHTIRRLQRDVVPLAGLTPEHDLYRGESKGRPLRAPRVSPQRPNIRAIARWPGARRLAPRVFFWKTHTSSRSLMSSLE